MENSEIKIINTEDGSQSLYSHKLGETYHSKHGAVQESTHVFIEAGFLRSAEKKDQIRILEVGFGTGLNALLTLKKCEEIGKKVDYYGLEPFPLTAELISELNYHALDPRFKLLHQAYDSANKINEFFNLTVMNATIMNVEISEKFDLIYYDAFGPPAQPEMWTSEIFAKLYSLLNEDGILVTYCAKGSVRRSMIEEGFNVERLAGPPGKREMLRATKPM